MLGRFDQHRGAHQWKEIVNLKSRRKTRKVPWVPQNHALGTSSGKKLTNLQDALVCMVYNFYVFKKKISLINKL